MITQVISVQTDYNRERDDRQEYFESVSNKLDEIIDNQKLDGLQEITEVLWENKSEILGKLALVLIKEKYKEFLEQEYCECIHCNRSLKKRGKSVKKNLHTRIGEIELYRPYFYCKHCKRGFYSIDKVLELSDGNKQYDLQELEVYLASKLPYEEARETYKKCTGNNVSTQHMFEITNQVAQDIDVLDVSPKQEEIEEMIKKFSEGKFWRPIVMIGVDGAHAPTRPEPSPYRGQRGKGQWRESKGFRIYLINDNRIVQMISWHQIQSDDELVCALQKVKDANLIPEHLVRLCFIADGAQWIWNKVSQIFPSARQILDFYHCSEYLHSVANLQYGQDTRRAKEWMEATFARLFYNRINSVIWGLQRMIPISDDAQQKIIDTIRYLSSHSDRCNYGASKRAGYHIGSGAIESANKFIGHARLKKSGAWWYPSLANNILKIRCAIYNNTFERIIKKYKERNQLETYGRRRA